MTPYWKPVGLSTPVMEPDEEGFPKSKDVLVYFSDGDFGVACCAIYDEEPEWFTQEYNVTKYVTHWMPLPDAPNFVSRCSKHPLQNNPCQTCLSLERLKEQGVCPDCEGAGEQGGQFCGGYWKCEACDGTGKFTEVKK